MNKAIPLLCIWLAASFNGHSLMAEESEAPLVVKLATESSLDPLYLLPMTSEQSEISESAMRQLEKILAFDLDHNGATFVAKDPLKMTNMGKAAHLTNWARQQAGKSGIFTMLSNRKSRGKSWPLSCSMSINRS